LIESMKLQIHITVVRMVIRSLPQHIILYYENISSEKLLEINCAITLGGYLDTCPKNDVIPFS